MSTEFIEEKIQEIKKAKTDNEIAEILVNVCYASVMDSKILKDIQNAENKEIN